jgi:hypothetical protein
MIYLEYVDVWSKSQTNFSLPLKKYHNQTDANMYVSVTIISGTGTLKTLLHGVIEQKSCYCKKLLTIIYLEFTLHPQLQGLEIKLDELCIMLRYLR